MNRMAAQVLGGVVTSLTCLATAIPVVLLALRGERITVIPTGWWLALFAVFFVCFLSSMWLQWALSRPVLLGAFAVQCAAAIALMLTSEGNGWIAILVVFNAAMAAYIVPTRVAAALIAANTTAVAVSATGSSALEVSLGTGLYLMLQGTAYLSVVAMAREADSRRRLAEANVRLRAAGALLAESTRAEERLRIARELHDLVGHQLTVLALELEIASHRAEGEAADSVERSRELTRGLLADVRDTVGEMRGRGGPRLRETLERIVGELPEPAVHLEVDDAIEVDEEHIRVLVRCVQEVVTNTIRHSEAQNLWIAVGADDRGIVFEAHDDGVGAREVEPGNGLRGMTERLEALGGQVRFSGENGFRVNAEVPAA